MAVFYGPSSSDTQYLKQFKSFLDDARQHSSERIIVLGDFNLLHINWSAMSPSTPDKTQVYFLKVVKDNFVWQLIDTPTQGHNILDLLLTTISHKFNNIANFDSIINTDHKLIEFKINLKILKQSCSTKRKF